MLNLSEGQLSKLIEWLLDKGLAIVIMAAALYVMWRRTEESNKIFIQQMERMELRGEARDKELIECYEARLIEAKSK